MSCGVFLVEEQKTFPVSDAPVFICKAGASGGRGRQEGGVRAGGCR